MAVKIWDAQSNAFKDAEIPMVWDSQAGAYKDSTGLVYDESKGAWDERWGDNKVYLYNQGNECTNVTGGWNNYKIGGSCQITKANDKLEFSMKNYNSGDGGGHSASIFTASKIDLSDYSSVKLVGSDFVGKTSGSPNCQLNLWLKKRDDAGGYFKYVQFVKVGNQDTFELTYDLSDITTKQLYIGISAYYASFNIDKIWLEK